MPSEREMTKTDIATLGAFREWMETQKDLNKNPRLMLGLLGVAEHLHREGHPSVDLSAPNPDFAVLRKTVSRIRDDEELFDKTPTVALSRAKSAGEKPAPKSIKPAAFKNPLDDQMMDIKSDFESWLLDTVGVTVTEAELASAGRIEPYDTIVDNYVIALTKAKRNKDGADTAAALNDARSAIIELLTPRIRQKEDRADLPKRLPEFEQEVKEIVEGKREAGLRSGGGDDDLSAFADIFRR